MSTVTGFSQRGIVKAEVRRQNQVALFLRFLIVPAGATTPSFSARR